MIQYYVKHGLSQTTVKINRDRHKPLYVDVSVDALLLREMKRSEKDQNRRRSKNKQQSGNFRFIGFYILFSVLGFVLSIFIGGIQPTVRWLSNPANYVLIIIAFILVFIILNNIIPAGSKNWDRRLMTFDNEVMKEIEMILHSIQREIIGTTVVQQCWNCFEDVKVDSPCCEHCGEGVNT